MLGFVPKRKVMRGHARETRPEITHGAMREAKQGKVEDMEERPEGLNVEKMIAGVLPRLGVENGPSSSSSSSVSTSSVIFSCFPRLIFDDTFSFPLTDDKSSAAVRRVATL